MSAPANAAPAPSPAPAAPQDAAEHPIAQALQASPQDLGHKVFVGNLPFSASNASIKELFGKVGTVTDAQIIHRGTRSLGYGFVTYTSESDAVSAVSQLDKSEIDGRQVNVEVAKPMPAAGANGAARAPRKAAQKAAQLAATKETAQEAQQQDGVDGAAAATGAKKARKPRKPRGPRAPRADDETEEAGDAPPAPNAVSDAADQLTAADGSAAPRKARKPRARKNRRTGAAADGESPAGEEGAPPALGEAKPAAGAGAGARQPRRRGPPAGSESQTLIFVGNLHFDVTNETLAAAFAPECAVKSAVVVTRKFGLSAGRSKGFAFVDFASHDDQVKALEQFQGKELNGRPMSLKVAIQPDEGATEGGDKAKNAAKAEQGEQQSAQQERNEDDAIIVAS